MNKDIVVLNNALDKMDLTDIYRTSHTNEAKSTFFSNVHVTFSKTDHMIGDKTSLKKFKKIEIISSIFLDHNGLKLEANLKEKTKNHSNSWKLNRMLLNNEWINNKIKEKSKSLWKQMKMNIQSPKVWDIAKAVLRGMFTEIQAYIKNIETFQINNLILHLQELEE